MTTKTISIIAILSSFICSFLSFYAGMYYNDKIRNREEFKQVIDLMERRNTLSNSVTSSAGTIEFDKRWDSYIKDGEEAWNEKYNFFKLLVISHYPDQESRYSSISNNFLSIKHHLLLIYKYEKSKSLLNQRNNSVKSADSLINANKFSIIKFSQSVL